MSTTDHPANATKFSNNNDQHPRVSQRIETSADNHIEIRDYNLPEALYNLMLVIMLDWYTPLFFCSLCGPSDGLHSANQSGGQNPPNRRDNTHLPTCYACTPALRIVISGPQTTDFAMIWMHWTCSDWCIRCPGGSPR